jgi:hypothetical protein
MGLRLDKLEETVQVNKTPFSETRMSHATPKNRKSSEPPFVPAFVPACMQYAIHHGSRGCTPHVGCAGRESFSMKRPTLCALCRQSSVRISASTKKLPFK